jgi:hypothetical protein
MNLDGISPSTDVSHGDIRRAVCQFMESGDFIIKDFWVDELFGGDRDR